MLAGNADDVPKGIASLCKSHVEIVTSVTAFSEISIVESGSYISENMATEVILTVEIFGSILKEREELSSPHD